MPITLAEFIACSETSPVIPAVNNEERLKAALKSESDLVYVLYGDICSINFIVESLHGAGKKAIVHADLIVGLASKEVAVDFLHNVVHADGIISMKPALIKRAHAVGMFAIQRFYVIDTMTYHNVEKLVHSCSPDVVEFMPVVLTKGMSYLMKGLKQPIVASGMVLDKEDVINALKIGVIAVTTTNMDMWDS